TNFRGSTHRLRFGLYQDCCDWDAIAAIAVGRDAVQLTRCPLCRTRPAADPSRSPVCAENSGSDVLVMQTADQGMRHDRSDPLNRAREGRVINEPIPRALFDGKLTSKLKKRYVVLDKPDKQCAVAAMRQTRCSI